MSLALTGAGVRGEAGGEWICKLEETFIVEIRPSDVDAAEGELPDEVVCPSPTSRVHAGAIITHNLYGTTGAVLFDEASSSRQAVQALQLGYMVSRTEWGWEDMLIITWAIAGPSPPETGIDPYPHDNAFGGDDGAAVVVG